MVAPTDGLNEHTIDVDEAGALLVRVEQRAERNGWHNDGHMWLYIAFEIDDVVTYDNLAWITREIGQPVKAGRYAAVPMLRPWTFEMSRQPGDDKPTTQLRRFAINVAYAEEEEIGETLGPALALLRQMIQQPGIVGFIACYEAYGHRNAATGTPAFRALMTGEIPHLSHHVGAEELRVATMVDIHSRTHDVQRWRGECSELHTDTSLFGDSTTSLRILMDTAADRLPAVEDFADRYPSFAAMVKEKGLM